MTYYTRKLPDGRILLSHGTRPMATYPDIKSANNHANLVTGKDATPYEEEAEIQSAQPVASPRGRPKKAKDK